MSTKRGRSSKDTVLVRVSIAVKRHHGHGNSYEGKNLIGMTYSFRGLVHYCHGGKHHCYHGEKHSDMQADMVLEKELEVLHPDPQTTEGALPHWAWLLYT